MWTYVQNCNCWSFYQKRRWSMRASIVLSLWIWLFVFIVEFLVKPNGLTVVGSMSEDHALSNREKVRSKPEKCKKRLPKCIIIGAQKSGTSALITFLSLHPDISAVLSPAETKFFSGNYEKGMKWYLSQMTCSYRHQLTIEKSPPYFHRGYVPGRVKAMNSSIKLLLTVKDPVSRTLSEYAMDVEHRRATRPLSELVMSPRGVIKESNKYIDHSLYYKHMQQWLKKFRRDQIYIIDGQNLITNPYEELNKVELFLGLKSFFRPDHFVFNETKGFYCWNTSTDSHSVPSCLGENKGRKHPHVGQKVVDKLNKFFIPLNNKFFHLVSQEFDWNN